MEQGAAVTTGEQLVALSRLSGVSALEHLLAITAGGGEVAGAGGFAGITAAPAIEYRDREVVVAVPVEKIVERVVERVVEVPTIVRIPATIPGLPEGEDPQVEMVDGVPLLAASRPILEAAERRVAERDADNTRIAAENARLVGEVEALSALFVAAAAQ